MATSTSKIVWRMGLPIKGAKGKYRWSPEFDSFELCVKEYAKWIDKQINPPCPIFSWRVAHIPQTESKA